jgi:hypothetical protein
MARRKLLTAALLLSLPALHAAEPGLMDLVMPDARVLMGVDVNRVLTSPFGRFVLKQIGEGEAGQLGEFAARTGFDPGRDLGRIVIAGKGEDGKQGGLVLVEGTFDLDRVLAEEAGRSGRKAFEWGGIPVISSPAESGGENWIAFPSPSLAVLGPRSEVEAALTRQANPAALDAAMATKVASVANHFDIWFVSTVSPAALPAELEGGQLSGMLQGEVFSNIEEALGGVRFGESIDFEGHLVTRTEQDAEALHNVFRFFTSLMAMQQPKASDPRAGEWLNRIQLRAEGRAMTLGFSIPQKEFEQLLEVARLHGPGKKAFAAPSSR